MRLKDSEVRAIINTTGRHTAGLPCEIYLFGSRIDNLKRGGDIDLLLIASEPLKSRLTEIKGRLKSDLSQALNDQRVDVTIATPDDLNHDIFLKSVFPHAVKLGSWPRKDQT